MRKLRFAYLLLAFIAVACSKSEENTMTVQEPDIDSLFQAYFDFKCVLNPLEPTKLGDYKYNDTLTNYLSDEFIQFSKEQYQSFLDAASKISYDSLSPERLYSLKSLKWDCEIKLEGLNNKLISVASPMFDQPTFKNLPINQIFSLHLFFSQIAGGGSLHPFNTAKDYNDWASRMEDYVAFLDTSMENMREGMELGIVLPKSIVTKMIPQISPLANPASLEEHLYYKPVLSIPDGISEEDKTQIETRFREILANKIIPKYKELEKFMADNYMGHSGTHSGISALPGGVEAYNYMIKFHTTTNMTADEVFNLGEQEVARITAEMHKVIEEIGFEGTLQEFFKYVEERSELSPFTDPDQVLEYYSGIDGTVAQHIESLFSVKPKAGFEVVRTEAFREASASAEYITGSKDGSRPGRFYVPIPDVESFNILTGEALFLHEAIPGHHYQLSLQQENEKLPSFMHSEGMGVYVEGWALYTESLGKELGLYTDPYQYFGMLSQEMHRAIRLVVDVGMHAKGWTREQAIQYSLEHEATSEEGAIAEIERYMVAPGQALSYKLGQLKIQALRDKANQSLGDSFDIKEFHNQILNTGSLPLVVLEEKIDLYISRKLSGDSGR